MCIALFAIEAHPRFPFVLLANRDESFARPTDDMHFWPEPFRILAGRDQKAGGTWLGINSERELALLTNFRLPQATESERSRGTVVLEALGANENFERNLKESGSQFAGFNLLFGRPTQLKWYNNIQGTIESITSGIHGLSNALLDTPWPKLLKGKALLERALSGNLHNPEPLFTILQDRECAPDHALPSTGLPSQIERALSSIFIEPHQGYGSRSGTVVMMDREGTYFVWERNYIDQTEQSFVWPVESVEPTSGGANLIWSELTPDYEEPEEFFETNESTRRASNEC